MFELQRPRQNSLRGHVGLVVEVFTNVLVSVLIVYLAVFVVMERFGIGVR